MMKVQAGRYEAYFLMLPRDDPYLISTCHFLCLVSHGGADFVHLGPTRLLPKPTRLPAYLGHTVYLPSILYLGGQQK